MARGLVTVELKGMKEFVKEMEQVVEEFPEITREALSAQEEVIEKAIRQNWVSTGGRVGDFVYDSVGQSTAFSKLNPADVVGTVGVYNIESVASSHGKTSKDLNAAQIAYWLEFGTSRLRGGGRKVKGVEYSEEQLISTTPRPFISTAFYSTIVEQEKAFTERFNQLADRIMK